MPPAGAHRLRASAKRIARMTPGLKSCCARSRCDLAWGEVFWKGGVLGQMAVGRLVSRVLDLPRCCPKVTQLVQVGCSLPPPSRQQGIQTCRARVRAAMRPRLRLRGDSERATHKWTPMCRTKRSHETKRGGAGPSLGNQAETLPTWQEATSRRQGPGRATRRPIPRGSRLLYPPASAFRRPRRRNVGGTAGGGRAHVSTSSFGV